MRQGEAMNKAYLATWVVVGMISCCCGLVLSTWASSGTGLPDLATITETFFPVRQNFNIKGLRPAMTLAEAERIVGAEIQCEPAASSAREASAALDQTVKQLLDGPSDGTEQAGATQRQIVQRIAEYKKLGRIAVLEHLAERDIDLDCWLPDEAKFTYANHAATVELGVKENRVRTIWLAVNDAKEEDLLRGLALKYRWADPSDSRRFSMALMKIATSLAAGVEDSEGNQLKLQLPGSGSGTHVITLMDKGIAASVKQFTREQAVAVSGMKDM